jgi:hypothetical protein
VGDDGLGKGEGGGAAALAHSVADGDAQHRAAIGVCALPAGGERRKHECVERRPTRVD